MENIKVNVIGAGLAGSEAAWQLANRGINVDLYEMRPVKMTSAHKTEGFAELICSNSLRAASITNAVGLLKEEMRRMNSIIMEAADNTRVEAGGALAVDRELFSNYVTKKIKEHPLINVITEEVTDILEGPTIIASGPLCSDVLSESIKKFIGEEYLYFFDSVAPIVTFDSINKDIAYLKSRYDKGEASYYNCPMTKEEFDAFYDALITADKVVPHDFELKVFEGCMAVEDMAARGRETLLFGPLKPVGLRLPGTEITPYAVVQLRQDNASKTLYNLVGFQTHLKWGEQQRVFRMIPGLENAEFVRYGVMHKNTFINSPKVLNKYYQVEKRKDLFFAGQITGVEGYLESASSGLSAAVNMYRYIKDLELIDFTKKTAIGSLSNYISTFNTDFQPMNVNFGIFEELNVKCKKIDRKEMYAKRALETLDGLLEAVNERK
ncbi:MAG: methylenetetrahydrofolate--tRNA-(uracil(54)-C(5))-methyltransferase (FADH(2)-oxidizing) TrmFO [Bacilli bacterium]|nr:methylenetetrahydrofolate--tRNA-(uracil(54)-C(5))-methyltransferase (FADH(2)-oxidizing) TrmFO [Bacilli bacterium]